MRVYWGGMFKRHHLMYILCLFTVLYVPVHHGGAASIQVGNPTSHHGEHHHREVEGRVSV